MQDEWSLKVGAVNPFYTLRNCKNSAHITDQFYQVYEDLFYRTEVYFVSGGTSSYEPREKNSQQ